MPLLPAHRFLANAAVGAALLTLAAGCSPTIAPYSGAAYQQAVDLKVVSLRLMDEAEYSYESRADDVEELEIALEKAYEFNRGRPRNEDSTQQWAILLDPERNLLGGFLALWKEERSLGRPFIVEAKRQVGRAFDSIITLESGKIGSGREAREDS